MEWNEVRQDHLLLSPEVKAEYEKIPNPYFEGEYIYFKDENGFEWPMYVGVDLANDEDKFVCDCPTQPMQPIESSDLAPARGVIKGLLYSLPIWIAAGIVALAVVGKSKGWW